MATPRLLLLDTASLYFRAFYGVPDRFHAPDGTSVNAVRGMLDFISRLVEDLEPTHIACCWDVNWRPDWRVDLVPTYKAHRVVQTAPGEPEREEVPEELLPQVDAIRDLLIAFGIPVVGHEDMEADDVIGTLATLSPVPVDVVTGDRDLFQLVDDARGVRVLYTARGVSKHDVVDDAWVQNKYGVAAAAYADFATMRGDASDGLPGVAGIGEKTAAALLAEFGSLEGIIEAAQNDASAMKKGPRAKVLAAGEYVHRAAEAVAVRRDLDLEKQHDDLAIASLERDDSAVELLAQRWGVERQVARLKGVLDTHV